MEPNFKEWMKPFQHTFDQDFFRSFSNLFDKNNENVQVKMNLYEGNNELLCVIFLPGINDMNKIALNVQGNLLEVNGKQSFEFDGFHLLETEYTQGEFSRTITLPYVIREDKIDATYKNGLLIVHLHKLLTNQNQHNNIRIRNLDD